MGDTSDFEKMERNGWSSPAIAKGYADGFEMASRHVARTLSDAVNAGPQTAVLDLCTGHGVVAHAHAARGATVTGLDFSHPMIALARANVPDAEFMHGDAMATGFPDARFDAVTIGFGVPHFPDPVQGLREAARVLKPSGKIAFSIWHGKGSDGAFGWLFDAVGRLGDPAVTLPAGPDAHALVDINLARQLLESTGFCDVGIIEVPSELHVPSPEALFTTFDGGAVRAASLLSQQSAATRAAIQDDLAMRTQAEGTRGPSGYIVPAPSVVITAVRA